MRSECETTVNKQCEYSKKNMYLLLIIGGLIGISIFMISYGYRIVNVTYDGWLKKDYNITDMTFAYKGWLFYRDSEWGWPLGLIKNMTYPSEVSLIYADAVPIVAVICKIFDGILPDTFQYMGIYTLLCFFLQGAFAAIIIYKSTFNKVASVVSAILLSSSSVLFAKSLIQVGVASNWLILAAYALYVFKDSLCYRKKVIWNCVLTFAAVGINMYYIPMVVGILCFMWIEEFFHQRGKESAIKGCAAILADVVVGLGTIYMFGGFEGEVIVSSRDLGKVSANINTLFNSFNQTGWKWSPVFNCNDGQWSGYSYIGCSGILLLVATAVLSIINRKRVWDYMKKSKIRLLTMGVMLLVFFVYALSPKVYLGSKLLIEWPLPEVITKLWSIFRTTGRFMYPILYAILLFSITAVFKLGKRKGVYILLVICAILHLTEFSKIMQSLNHTYFKMIWDGGSTYMNNHEFWEDIAEGKDELLFMPAHNRNNKVPSVVAGKGRSEEMAFWAQAHDLRINDTYLARRDEKAVTEYRERHWEKIYEEKEPDDRIIYVFFETVPTKCVQDDLLNIYYVDNYYIGLKEEINVHKYDGVEEIKGLKEINVLPKQWQYIENAVYTENGLTIHPNGYFNGMKLPLRAGRYQVEMNGEDLKTEEIRCDVEGIGSIDIEIEEANSQKIVYTFELLENADRVDFTYTNEHDEEVLINEILLTEIL